jgi:hypothetical protein
VYLILMNIPFIMVRTPFSHSTPRLVEEDTKPNWRSRVIHGRETFSMEGGATRKIYEGCGLSGKESSEDIVISRRRGEYMYSHPIRPVSSVWLHLHCEMIGWSPNLAACRTRSLDVASHRCPAVTFSWTQPLPFLYQHLHASLTTRGIMRPSLERF